MTSDVDKTKLFIEKSKQLHGDLYNYSQVEFISSRTKVIIKCHDHGYFLQTPKNHLKKHGCPKCGVIKCSINLSSTLEEFIEKANRVHNNRYDYSKVIYVNCSTKIIIKCLNHGEFMQTPYLHLCSRYGCRKCIWETIERKPKRKFTIEQFIEEANKIHNNKYDYSEINLINMSKNITIICPIHKHFEQRPSNHLSGSGCNQCGKESSRKKQTQTLENFIERANNVHRNKYDYSRSIYINSQTPLIIICPIHGDFNKNPVDHTGMSAMYL